MHGASNAALNLALGSRIQVYWPLDDAWCAPAPKRDSCPVTRSALSAPHPRASRYAGSISTMSGSKVMVDYDDGATRNGEAHNTFTDVRRRACAEA